jgi:hypothetical protein
MFANQFMGATDDTASSFNVVLSIALAIVSRQQLNEGIFVIVTYMCCTGKRACPAAENGAAPKPVDLNDKFCYR